ncbi:DNA or RNA helicase of superfamily II [Pseudomonas cavernicola]|uniref:DNA or RNA helicase of superfamily II n=1 Tax=Pseudomonas cavernicola TaxID=2320866 RepID=A0A418XPP0_9PSED|nr:cysteine-rich CWC family protein [Pseudomonas cavernicola]RJG14430.1 DNA or RNA helicase of superfamily II [Pseudomonas cavernicola]
MTITLDPSRCPLCGLSNTCTHADPATASQPCWCFSLAVEPLALQRIPSALLNRACLCPRCAQNLPAAAAGSRPN